MGFFKKVKKAFKKVIKVAAPIAASFVPGVGGMLSNVLNQALNAPKEPEEPQAVDTGPPPGANLGALQAATTAQNRFPQPIAYGGAAPAASTAIQATDRARRLLAIAKGAKVRGLGARRRVALTAKAIMRGPSRARLRARFNRGDTYHSGPNGAIGPTERFRRLRGRSTMPQVRRSRRRQGYRSPASRRRKVA